MTDYEKLIAEAEELVAHPPIPWTPGFAALERADVRRLRTLLPALAAALKAALQERDEEHRQRQAALTELEALTAQLVQTVEARDAAQADNVALRAAWANEDVKAFSTPSPGAALLERLHKLEAFVAAYDVWRDGLNEVPPKETRWDPVVEARAALEEKP